MAEHDLEFGGEIIISWGLDEVHGTGHEIYGEEPRVQVVVMLTPELSGNIVAEATTVVVPLGEVRRAAPAR